MLRAGTLVRVKTPQQILKTLDDKGKLEGLPFMPEMLKYCGSTLTVQSSAHKSCDTVGKTGGRWIKNAVHLENARCNGKNHGGCQADCLIFWKEDWLEPPNGVNCLEQKPSDFCKFEAHLIEQTTKLDRKSVV